MRKTGRLAWPAILAMAVVGCSAPGASTPPNPIPSAAPPAGSVATAGTARQSPSEPASPSPATDLSGFDRDAAAAFALAEAVPLTGRPAVPASELKCEGLGPDSSS